MPANSTPLTQRAPNSFAEFRLLTTVATLRKCPLFADLPAEAQREIARIGLIKPLAKGEYLFHEGGPVHALYVVQTGAVKLHRVNLSGKEQVIHVFRANETLGVESLLSDSGYLADANATESSRVVMIRKSDFMALMRRHPEMVLGIMKSVASQFHALLNLLEDRTLKDVPTRLAHWLIQHCPDPESHDPYTIELPMAKRLLASELGTVSETFSRTLARFRVEKLVTIEGRTVTLLCPSKLSRMVRGDLGMDRSSSPALAWKASERSRHSADFSAPAGIVPRTNGHKANGVASAWTVHAA